MANTYTQIYIQLVFAVSGRVNLLGDSIRPEVYKYMTGIIQQKRHKLLCINGMPDHVHILVGLNPREAISVLIHDVKRSTTEFIRERGWFGGGYVWQNGYGAFSYSRSHLDGVLRYIQKQEIHHRQRSFRQEYLALLKRFAVPHDDRYVFEFCDERD